MSFIRLQGIDFKNGLHAYQKKQLNYQYITCKSMYFKENSLPDFVTITRKFDYSFYQQTLSETNFFYLSEPNLVAIFSDTQNFYIDFIQPLTSEITETIKAKFYEGYKFGQLNFINEIGNSFPSFSLEYKKSYIESMGKYCLKNLFFDGSTAPEYVYALGYIQACLVLACKEYEKILVYEVSISKATNNIQEKYNNKIEITRDHRNDVISIWNSLQDVAMSLSSELAKNSIFKDKKAIIKILGMIFFETTEDALITEVEVKKLTVSGNKDIINSIRACMYLTYKLNNEKGALNKYALLLKETFSCFNNNTKNSIQTNLSKSVIPFVKLLRKINKNKTSITLDVINKNNLIKNIL